MRSKYHLALKFFNDTKNEKQLEICYKEIEGFLDNFEEFSFFFELDALDLDPKVEVRLFNEQPEIKELIQNEPELFSTVVDNYRYRATDETFSNYKYNFELFKHALEKIFEDERKENEEKKKQNGETSSSFFSFSLANYKSNDFFMIFSAIFFLVTIAAIGYFGYKGFK